MKYLRRFFYGKFRKRYRVECKNTIDYLNKKIKESVQFISLENLNNEFEIEKKYLSYKDSLKNKLRR